MGVEKCGTWRTVYHRRSASISITGGVSTRAIDGRAELAVRGLGPGARGGASRDIRNFSPERESAAVDRVVRSGECTASKRKAATGGKRTNGSRSRSGSGLLARSLGGPHLHQIQQLKHGETDRGSRLRPR